MLSSHITKLENKIEQITKIANERLRNDLQSHINELKINLQNTIKISEKKQEKILGNQSWRTSQKCYVKY